MSEFLLPQYEEWRSRAERAEAEIERLREENGRAWSAARGWTKEVARLRRIEEAAREMEAAWQAAANAEEYERTLREWNAHAALRDALEEKP